MSFKDFYQFYALVASCSVEWNHCRVMRKAFLQNYFEFELPASEMFEFFFLFLVLVAILLKGVEPFSNFGTGP